MRNLATVGGSIYSRFGFSDILTCLMALDTYVELYHGRHRCLWRNLPNGLCAGMTRDILVRIIIKRRKKSSLYHPEEFGNGFPGHSLLLYPGGAMTGMWRWEPGQDELSRENQGRRV